MLFYSNGDRLINVFKVKINFTIILLCFFLIHYSKLLHSFCI